MELSFFKYQGTGNDFVILDNRQGQFDLLTKKQIAFLCDRRFGIGADGLMLLNLHAEYDFEMKYFNADGGPSSMCGNGGRCLVKFAADRGLVQTKYRFLAVDGAHEASIGQDGTIALKMQDVTDIQEESDHFILNTGSPHFVQFEHGVNKMDVYTRGREIRNSGPFKEEGINVNFIEFAENKDRIIVRTYERGVEDETYSCGTGVTACAIVAHRNENGFNRVQVQTKGGLLSVEFEKHGNHYHNIWLIGPAEKVFTGSIFLPSFHSTNAPI